MVLMTKFRILIDLKPTIYDANEGYKEKAEPDQ